MIQNNYGHVKTPTTLRSPKPRASQLGALSASSQRTHALLRIIDLLPNNCIRINVARYFDWLPLGPIKQCFKSGGISDFLESHFTHEDETMAFVHGMFTDQAQAQIHDESRQLCQKIAELH